MADAAPGLVRSQCDLFIYGASPAGLGAAVGASRQGLRVVVAEPLGQIGGLVTGGLSRTDLGRPETVGGIFREFMGRVVSHYEERYGSGAQQVKDSLEGQRFEPRVAHAVLEDMVQEADVEIRLRRAIISAEVGEESLLHVTLASAEGKETIDASYFVDASYEGDLLAAAGCEYRTGREARAEYDEEYAGHLFWDPSTGQAAEEGTGEGDARIQAYCFRLTVTDDPDNLRPIEKPPDYDGGQYALLRQYLEAAPRRLKDVLLLGPLPNRKWDINNWGFCWQSLDYVEANSGYPEGSWEQRRAVADAHRRYQQGLFYFLQHDPAVPSDLRGELARFGLCRDEFVEGEGWPEQLYVREARRLVGEHVFTEHDARRDRRQPDAVGVGSYPMDSHATQWYEVGQATPAPEGFFMCSVRPYEIPFRALLPKTPRNLLVPVCLSATHAGYGTLRMEPVMTNLGMVCGYAAARAKADGGDFHNLDVKKLQQSLEQSGQIIRAPEK
ncbi:MAG: FAD-dependent oxidoreductase [Armatimonadetes bacterium]|nr:FAD-dependent oxidoreductase [Armatimonadota bacterium]